MNENNKLEEIKKPPHGGGLEGLLLISHLVAASENNVIGKNNQLPWNLPDDFKYFKNKTWGMPVIMGRNTFESLANSLPGRFNIVVTSQNLNKENIIVAHSIDEAIAKGIETDCKEIFIIGGGKIFEQSMNIVNRIYITRVHTIIDGDAFYPVIDEPYWERVSSDKHFADDKHAFDYTFEIWQKK